MDQNVIELVKGYLTPDVIQRAAALVGESPASTRRALETATPAIVTALAGEASSATGAQRVARVIEEAGLRAPMSGVTERLGAASGEELIELGRDLLGRIFGPRMGPIADATAGASGVQPSSMRSLLGLAAPLVLGMIGNKMHTQKLDAAGLTGLLSAEKRAATAALPGVAASSNSAAPAVRSDGRAEAPRAPAAREPRPRWPLLLVIPAAILGALVLRRAREPATTDWGRHRGFGAGLGPQQEAPPVEGPQIQAPPVEVPRPGGGVQRFGAGTTVYDLDRFLSSSGDPSRRFVLADVTFNSESARLTPSSLDTLAGIAAVLKAHPSAQILLEGHTDRSGAPSTAQQLSLARAEAVKSSLVERGIDPDRIATAGAGSDRPIASNDTPEGRAKNRRTELVVTRR